MGFRGAAGLLCAGLMAVSACGHLTPAGLLTAARFDPLRTPPDRIVVALQVPMTVRLSDGDATIRIAFAEDDARLVDVAVPLSIRPGDGSAPSSDTTEETTYVARLEGPDAARFASAQRDILRYRALGSEGKGSLSVTVTGGCLDGPALEAFPVSTWLSPGPDAAFVRLTRRADAFDFWPEDLPRLKPCDDPEGRATDGAGRV